jgi:uncharacterized protein (TIGR04141 family)
MDTLTVYLLKPKSRAADALDPRKRLVRHEVRDAGRLVGELYVAQSKDETPRWLRYFDGAVQPLPRLSNRSASALLLVPRGAQLFAVTFGFGRHFLKVGTWVENFGLRVTLNCIEPASIRSLERKTFDAISRLTRTQAVHEGTAAQFGVDVEQDLLRAITGRPTDERLGARLTGADALIAPAPKRVRDMPARLGTYYRHYSGTKYRDGFAWVDHIAEVKDAKHVSALDDVLRERLRDGRTDGISLAPPDMIDWARVRGFRFRVKGETFAEMRVEDLRAALDARGRAHGATRGMPFKSRRVIAVDDAGTAVDVWTLDRCLVCELEIGADTFVRSNGCWYRIERSLVREVNAAVGALERRMPTLLPYEDANEGAYNERVAAANRGFVLVDKRLVSHGGGSSRIEFCDLFTAKKQMIHVKRYCGSATLSHLFAQGAVGANLLLTDRAFRKKLDEKLPASHRVGGDQPDAREYEIVYAIVEGSGRALVEVLPFFSRLMLRNTARQLGAVGFGVSAAAVCIARRPGLALDPASSRSCARPVKPSAKPTTKVVVTSPAALRDRAR